jgi:lipoyl(octanoyl) transferase
MRWEIADKPITYPDALAKMEAEVKAVQDQKSKGLVWLLEHPPLYTAGTSAKQTDLLDHKGFPVYETGRGGQFTYHGPGQRVGYVMMDLTEHGKDVRKYVCNLEEWIIQTLAEFDIESFRREGRIGIWVNHQGAEKKIAALGVRVKKWVTMHGIAINLNPDLSHFSGIVPCGISEFGVTSLNELGKDISISDLDKTLKATFENIF